MYAFLNFSCAFLGLHQNLAAWFQDHVGRERERGRKEERKGVRKREREWGRERGREGEWEEERMRSSITFSDLEVADHHTSHRLTQSSKCKERTSLYELYQDQIIRKNIFWLCLENRICHIAFSKFVVVVWGYICIAFWSWNFYPKQAFLSA